MGRSQSLFSRTSVARVFVFHSQVVVKGLVGSTECQSCARVTASDGAPHECCTEEHNEVVPGVLPPWTQAPDARQVA